MVVNEIEKRVGLYLDKRVMLKDGTYPIKYRVINKGTFLINSGFHITENEWDNGTIAKNAINQGDARAVLKRKVALLKRTLVKVYHDGELALMDNKTLKRLLEEALEEKTTEERLFPEMVEAFLTQPKSPNTMDSYRQTAKKVANYDSNACLSSMTADWLDSFEAWLSGALLLKVNTISIHMRNIRAVFNWAIDRQLTEHYPFLRRKIRSEVTKRDCHLTREQFYDLCNAHLEEHQQKYRDLFVLMMYLRGIRPSDLLGNKSTELVGNRLRYRCMKTGRLFDVKVEPEAMRLLSYYMDTRKGVLRRGFLDVCAYEDYRNFVRNMTYSLSLLTVAVPMRIGLGGRKMREEVIEPKLTSYWARHTYATMAYKVLKNKDMVSRLLGHSFGNRITDSYIEYDKEDEDEANRIVIDFLNRAMKEREEIKCRRDTEDLVYRRAMERRGGKFF